VSGPTAEVAQSTRLTQLGHRPPPQHDRPKPLAPPLEFRYGTQPIQGHRGVPAHKEAPNRWPDLVRFTCQRSAPEQTISAFQFQCCLIIQQTFVDTCVPRAQGKQHLSECYRSATPSAKFNMETIWPIWAVALVLAVTGKNESTITFSGLPWWHRVLDGVSIGSKTEF
jgi:hypothetical protein